MHVSSHQIVGEFIQMNVQHTVIAHSYASSGSGVLLYKFLSSSPGMLGRYRYGGMDDVQVKRAIHSSGERMRHAKVKDEQFRVIEDVVCGWDTFVSLPTFVMAFCYGYIFDEYTVKTMVGIAH